MKGASSAGSTDCVRFLGEAGLTEMIKFIVSFGAGVYAGVYISQNYQVPRVDEPQELWRKVKDFADQYRKSPPGV